jgi:phosphatidate cytidylyltransferase
MVVYRQHQRTIPLMLIKRVLASLALAAIGIPAIIAGGNYFPALIIILLGIATWEYGNVFHAAGSKPSEPILIGGVVLLLLLRTYLPGQAAIGLTLIFLAAMTWHLIDYEKGREKAASDFTVTVAGIVYLGWIGAYLIDIRRMPNGLWWLLLVLPAVWLADMAAYFIGSRFGRHKLSPRLSPKKSWEGYWAGVIFGTFGTIGLAILWHSLGAPAVAWWKAGLLGAAISTLTTFGDLGESMLKRQAGLKDASNIIPGHGGVLDRMDSWLWAGALGYVMILFFLA